MSTRNASYARIVDAQTVSNDNKPQKRPKKAPKSPETARTSFGGKTSQTKAQKADRAVSQFTPAPNRAPQPRGMGERGVNWQAHSTKMQLMRDGTKGNFSRGSGSKQEKANKRMRDKAAKAAHSMRNVRKDFSKGKGPKR